MTKTLDQALAEIEALKAKLAATTASNAQGFRVYFSDKEDAKPNVLSVRCSGKKNPVWAYTVEWARILKNADKIKAYMAEHWDQIEADMSSAERPAEELDEIADFLGLESEPAPAKVASKPGLVRDGKRIA